MLVKDLVKTIKGIDVFEYQGEYYYYFEFLHTKDVPAYCMNKKVISVEFYIDYYGKKRCLIIFDNR